MGILQAVSREQVCMCVGQAGVLISSPAMEATEASGLHGFIAAKRHSLYFTGYWHTRLPPSLFYAVVQNSYEYNSLLLLLLSTYPLWKLPHQHQLCYGGS